MSHRIGACSACGATYKLPASFAHDQARCKQCGGVVEIGPPQPEAPAAPAAQRPPAAAPPIPARMIDSGRSRAGAPKSPPAAQGSPSGPASSSSEPKKERSGPSMRERLLAQKRAEAAGARPAATPARSGRTEPQRAAPASAARPSAARPPAARGVQRAKAAAAAAPAASRAGGSSDRSSRSAGASRRRGAAGRRRDGEEESDEKTYGQRGGRRGKKQNASLLPGLIALGVLVVLAGAAGFYVTMDREQPQAAERTPEATSEVAAAPAAEGEPAPLAAPPVETTLDPAGSGEQEVETEGGAGSAPAPPRERATGDPTTVDLSAIADFDPIPGTSEERWTELRNLAADTVDPLAGAAGNRARLQLEQAGKEAFPAILNAMKRLNLDSEDGFRAGDVLQKTLQHICNGNNFGWKYHHDEGWLYFNKRVVENWAKAWDKAKDDEAYWLRLSKQDKAEEPAKQEPQKSDDVVIDRDEFDFDFDDGF